MMPSHSRGLHRRLGCRAPSPPRPGRAMPPIGGRPASTHPRRKRRASTYRLVEVARDRRRGQQPLDGKVVQPRGGTASRCVAARSDVRFEVAGGQVDHRSHVEGVRVLPSHLDVAGPRREQLDPTSGGGNGLVQLAADEVRGGQLVERVALKAGVAHPMGQVDGTFGQVGVRRVKLVRRGGDGQHGRLDVDITGGERARLAQQRPLRAGRRQLGHDARCVRDQLGSVRRARARRVAGRRHGGPPRPPHGKPHRLVARMPAPGHGRAEVQRLRGIGGVGRAARPPLRTVPGPRSASPVRR